MHTPLSVKRKITKNRPIIVLLVIMIAATELFAFRPFITDDAGTVPPVTFELETAADYWQNQAYFGLCFKHGVTERMDIGIAFRRCTLPEHEKGYDPAEFLMKFGLIPDYLSASFSGSFSDPCYNAMLIYSQPISFFSIHANLGYSATGPTTEGFVTYDLAGIIEIQRFSTGAEFGGTHESLNWWQLGVRFAITEWFAADAAFGGDFEKEINFNAATGLFFAFPLPESGD